MANTPKKHAQNTSGLKQFLITLLLVIKQRTWNTRGPWYWTIPPCSECVPRPCLTIWSWLFGLIGRGSSFALVVRGARGFGSVRDPRRNGEIHVHHLQLERDSVALNFPPTLKHCVINVTSLWKLFVGNAISIFKVYWLVFPILWSSSHQSLKSSINIFKFLNEFPLHLTTTS